MTDLYFHEICNGAILPAVNPNMFNEYAMEILAGYNLVLTPKSDTIVRTGLAVCIPRGFFGQIGSLSHLSMRGVTIVPEFLWPFTEDTEIMIHMKNHGNDFIPIPLGTSIASLIIHKPEHVTPKFLKEESIGR